MTNICSLTSVLPFGEGTMRTWLSSVERLRLLMAARDWVSHGRSMLPEPVLGCCPGGKTAGSLAEHVFALREEKARLRPVLLCWLRTHAIVMAHNIADSGDCVKRGQSVGLLCLLELVCRLTKGGCRQLQFAFTQMLFNKVLTMGYVTCRLACS